MNGRATEHASARQVSISTKFFYGPGAAAEAAIGIGFLEFTHIARH